ncbi:hypothetical protein CsSME_00007690 [Camellia sinensis var. sinensis]
MDTPMTYSAIWSSHHQMGKLQEHRARGQDQGRGQGLVLLLVCRQANTNPSCNPSNRSQTWLSKLPNVYSQSNIMESLLVA